MSDENIAPTATAYAVLNFGQEGKQDASWVKIGKAWGHRDDKGFDVVLETIPKSGHVVLRLNNAKEN